MSSSDFELVTLRNGHRAVRHIGHDEVMHPSVGPWQEANALYVEQSRLRERLVSGASGPLCLFDVGLGAAANVVAALTCWAETGRARPLVIHSFEIDLQPLKLALADPEGFAYLQPWRAELEELCTARSVQRPGLSWTLHPGDVLTAVEHVADLAEVVFFDPFSPESNPTLWTAEAIRQVRARCSEDAELFTYSASTRTRVSFLLGGFFVGVGRAIGTKQETTVAATRLDRLAQPLDERWLLRWTRSSARAPHGAPELTEAMDRAVRAHPQFTEGWARGR